MKPNSLEQRRDKAAEDLWLNADLDEVLDVDGWTADGDVWSRAYFVTDEENPDGDSVMRTFGVRFAPGSTEVLDSWN